MNFWSDLVQLFWRFHCFFPRYKSHNAASSASLVFESCQLAYYRSKLRREGHENRLCPSSPAFQICQAAPRTVKPAGLISWGFVGNEGNIERATSWHIQMPGVTETAFRCWWCCIGVDGLLHSRMLRGDTVLGTETFCMKTNFTQESPGNRAVAHQQEKTWKTTAAVFRSQPTLACLPLFLRVHKALPEIPLNVLPNIF